MTTAKEATTITTTAIESQILYAKMKADDLNFILEQFIILAAQEGEYSTKIYPFKLCNLKTDIAKPAFINRIKINLETNGYTVNYHTSDDSIDIKWPRY